MKLNNKKIGCLGEKEASKYLRRKNYKILEKNYKNKIGEIDIIAQKGSIIIFVEVKTRKTNRYGYPWEAVTRQKQNKIIKVAQGYIKMKKLKEFQYRFDIIEIYLNSNKKINHIKDAFWVN